jgi:gliding motility-associated-like protein
MRVFYVSTVFLFSIFYSVNSQTKLTHNIGDDLVIAGIGSCNEPEYWARTFTLSDFGITLSDEFVINTGSMGVWWSVGGERAIMQFNIYSIDSNFPNTFSESNLIGSSQQEFFPYVQSFDPKIVTLNFENPVVIPANIERILVEIKKVDGPNIGFNAIQIAGTAESKDFSWYKGCIYDNPYKKSIDFGGGRRPSNFYINVEGEIRPIKDFPFNLENLCYGGFTKFILKDTVDSVFWNFDDPTSGIDNTSTDFQPSHIFTSPGTYEVSVNATVGTYTATETTTITIYENPIANSIDDVEACEDVYGRGISTKLNTSSIESQVLGDQTGMVVTYFDSNGNILPNPLPNPMTNNTAYMESIRVRVANKGNLNCYAETSFNLIVKSLPRANLIDDIFSCDDNNDGFTLFNVDTVEADLLGGQTGMVVEFFREDGQQLPNPLPSPISNIVQNEETITARITNPNTNCYDETTFKLIVAPLPLVNNLDELVGCDDNNDGISEYFDTSNIESNVLGGQTGVEVSYYDSMGNFISNKLANPYTNITPNEETITVRVTNTKTSCYAETPLVLRTSNKPQIQTPNNIYGCNQGNGFSTFNLSSIESEIIGSQPDLNLHYFDSNGNEITNQITSSFENTKPWIQTIYVRVENVSSNLCFSETSFNLLVNELPQVDIDDSYFLCNLEPSYFLVINDDYESFVWTFEDGSIISNSNEANLVEAGNYSLTVGKLNNGVICENTFYFELIRSILPSITNVDYQELSNNNFIKIMASGDGEFEYSIDGINYKESNEFSNILGGIYNVSVRDKYGCGEDTQQIVIIDYPKYFTPNGDGSNDTWQIAGVSSQFQANSDIYIYDRYGKLLKQLATISNGWDGTFNGKMLPNDDYWFTVLLEDGRLFKGHFTLKR